MKIEDLRNEIDKVDDKIAKLYQQRMEISKQVGEYKKSTKTALVNSKREKEILNRVTNDMNSDIKVYAKRVYETLFDTSKAYQNQILDLQSKSQKEILTAIENGIEKFPIEASVACQGIDGSYSSIACSKFFEFSRISFFKNFDGVFQAVEKGFSDYGILPIENSTAGSVGQVYDLMKQHKFYIVKSLKLRISHCLLANPNVDISKIKEIYSHEMAILQCSEFLKEHEDIKVTVVANTAVGAKMVAESNRDDVACISSFECAGIYGLSVLQKEIENSFNNFTRFIVISKTLKIFSDSNKISLLVGLPHESGSLNKLLNKFSTLGLNLTKLESRPMTKSSFEFLFYFDFEAKVTDKAVQNLIAELDMTTDEFTFLGSYHEII